MKGETPVPGPIMTMGWSGSVGRWNEFLRRQKIGTCMSVCMCVDRVSCLAIQCSIPQYKLVCQLKEYGWTVYTNRYMYRYVCDTALSNLYKWQSQIETQ